MMANVCDSEEQLVLELELELEVKKKRLLEELESALVPKDSSDKIVTALPNPIRPSLGIEVIDETALLHSVVKNGASKQSTSRRRGGGSKNTTPTTATTTTTNNKKPEESNSKSKIVKKYSRKEMEALRFLKLAQQRKLWKAIHASLQIAVANEYETLLFTPQDPLPRNKPILSAADCENMDSENVSPEDPSCIQSLMGEERAIVEECSEDDDSEEDCASILRPAFLVAGEPNFDAGPPEDGWEYLRRVRWEADQIPKVKVAKLDRSKFNKEQSDYMLKIPDIAKCPEHLLPLKQWEDVFLAEFSALRMNYSCLDGSSAICSSNLQHGRNRISQLVGNDYGEFSGVTNRDVLLCNNLSIGKANDEPTNWTAEATDNAPSPESPGSKTSIDQTSSSSPSPPLLTVMLAMDSVARVSMLLKRIRSLEPANTLTKNDCMWLFALCATVDAPLDADTCAALRSLLRKCASIRAGKAELDDEVVMLNILATISGRYFGQSEN